MRLGRRGVGVRHERRYASGSARHKSGCGYADRQDEGQGSYRLRVSRRGGDAERRVVARGQDDAGGDGQPEGKYQRDCEQQREVDGQQHPGRAKRAERPELRLALAEEQHDGVEQRDRGHAAAVMAITNR